MLTRRLADKNMSFLFPASILTSVVLQHLAFGEVFLLTPSLLLANTVVIQINFTWQCHHIHITKRNDG